jgi:hypothetical protein
MVVIRRMKLLFYEDIYAAEGVQALMPEYDSLIHTTSSPSSLWCERRSATLLGEKRVEHSYTCRWPKLLFSMLLADGVDLKWHKIDRAFGVRIG